MTEVLDRSKPSLKGFLYDVSIQIVKVPLVIQKSHVHNWLIKDLKAAGALINDSIKDLVKNHLREFGLDLSRGEFHKTRNVRDFNS